MTTCTITVTLQSITHSGDDIGDDWSYGLTEKGPGGAPEIDWSVPEESDRGQPGVNQLGGPITWTIYRECNGGLFDLSFEAHATEHDPFLDDKGHNPKTMTLSCLTDRSRDEFDIEVPVHEQLGGTNRVKFHIKLDVRCVP